MHTCKVCGKEFEKVRQTCDCGSSAFVFTKNGNGKKIVALDLENIRMLERGVFEIDLKSLSRDPVVVMDENGVYYVRLPIVKNTF
jgi:predicted  nucleic acid-binding Zn-ribbon protein